MQTGGWNSTEIQGPTTSVTFLGVGEFGACRDVLSKVKSTWLGLAPPVINGSLFEFGGTIYTFAGAASAHLKRE